MRAIDCWVNVRMGGARASWQERVALDYFKRSAGDVFRDLSIAETLEMMDRLGITRAILPVRADFPNREILEFAERHPDRFAIAANVDPRRGMRAVGDLVALVRQHPVVAAQVVPCIIDLPPDDRAYYPMYAKCCELALPITINTGIPGPPLPGRCQDPMHLDDVCLFFPDLTIVMANGADPWWAVAIRLMLKYPRLHLMTSAYAPKYLPVELVHYMNTRGRDKILFATDHPFLTMERALAEAAALDLRDGVLDHYLFENANRVFFSARQATDGG
jgi:predicted TIM-barrel fold metal-dependent hydrolase